MTRKKKIALLTLPLVAFVVLSSSAASSYAWNGTNEQKTARREARELRKGGENEEARKVLRKAGVTRFGHKKHKGAHVAQGKEWNRIEIRKALETHDFNAFRNAVAYAPFASLVTQESFDTLVKAYKLRSAGDFEGARDMLRDVGFPHVHMMGFGKNSQ